MMNHSHSPLLQGCKSPWPILSCYWKGSFSFLTGAKDDKPLQPKKTSFFPYLLWKESLKKTTQINHLQPFSILSLLRLILPKNMFTKQIVFEKVSVVFPFSQVLDTCEADGFKDRILRWSQASQGMCASTEFQSFRCTKRCKRFDKHLLLLLMVKTLGVNNFSKKTRLCEKVIRLAL